MPRRWLRILSFAALAPLAVDIPGASHDSSATSISIAVGAGSYAAVARGCEGNVLSKRQRYFRDMGFAVEHRTSGPLAFGVRQTVLREMPGYGADKVLVNPHVSLEGRLFGIGVEYIAGLHTPEPDDYDIWPASGHLRFGSRTGRVYLSAHMLEDIPIVSGGGGAIRVGIGVRPSPNFEAWMGLGSGIPYDNAGLVVRSDVLLHRNVSLNLAGRLGKSEDLDENSLSAGLTFRFPHGP